MSALLDWRLGMAVFIDTVNKACVMDFPEVFASVTVSTQ